MINGFETPQDEIKFNIELELIYKTIKELKTKSDTSILNKKDSVYNQIFSDTNWNYDNIVFYLELCKK